jgi:hypothetical protein
MKNPQLLVVFSVVLIASGCAASPADEPASNPTGSVSATTEPASTESATDPAAAPTGTAAPTATADAAVITTVGYGDLKLGTAVPESTALVAYNPDYCAVDGGEASETTGRWISTVKEDDLFELPTEDIGIGAPDTVLFIQVVGPDADPSALAQGDTAGICPA